MSRHKSKQDHPARPVPRLRPPPMEDITDALSDELLELESQLTIFQLMLMVQAHEQGEGGVWLWEPTWVWINQDDAKLYQAAHALDAMQLREMLQIKQLETLGLIRLMDQAGEGDWYWMLTARGEMAVATYLSALADHQPEWEPPP